MERFFGRLFLSCVFLVLLAVTAVVAKPASKDVASECKQPIGIQTGFLEDRDIKTSSAKNFTSHGAWCAGTNNDKQFYAVDLGEDFLLTKIATQGKVDNKDRYVKSYELQYSSDNKKWNSYLSDGKQSLDGNKDTFTVKYHKLDANTVGRYVKLLPKQWNNGICTRMELYGCSIDDLQKKNKVPAAVAAPLAAAAAGAAAGAKDVPKRDSEAKWNFFAQNAQNASNDAADSADLLELTKQLGTPGA